MRCRVQNVTRLPNGTTATKDREVTTSGNRLRIGRGTDNDIVLKDLSVALRHADVVMRDFDIVVEAVGDSVVRFDEVAAGRGVLAPDTEIGIGPYQIRLLPPERGFDLVLSLESGEAAATTAPAAPPQLRLRGGLLARRPLSWLLFLGVLVGFLVLPILAHRGYPPDAAPALGDGRIGNDLPSTRFAGFDHVWDTGELANPHKFLEQRCQACHVVGFRPIDNEDCGACHGTVRHHFADPGGVIATALKADGLDPARCNACHADHQGADGAVPRQQALCVTCHEDLARFAGGGKPRFGTATDFGLEHPEFRPSVVVDAADQRTERLRLGGPVPVRESSGLRFDHACHLGGDFVRPARKDKPSLCANQDGLIKAYSLPPKADAALPEPGTSAHVEIDGVLAADFVRKDKDLLATLTCASCHLPDAGGATMRPVRMEDHCSYCHALEFDDDKPERVLPHGKSKEVVDVLTYFYGAEAVRPPLVRTDPTTKLRRKPGAKAEPAVAPVPAPAAGQEAAGQQANTMFAKRLERVFADDGLSTCGFCHRTSATKGEKGIEYDVLPVQVQRIWEPLARFDHAAHADLSCIGCHDNAPASTDSSTVLLPPIATCRACHQGEAAQAAVPSTCTMCHVYHQEKGTCPIVPGPGLALASPADCPHPAMIAAQRGANN